MSNPTNVRDKNRASIQQFFQLHGEARAELFDENGCKELTYAANGGAPQRWEGKDEVLKNFTANKTFFPTWAWENITIDETQDPDKFWVEAYGKGQQNVGSSQGPTSYENHYVFCFRMKDGRILEMREINNPLKLMKALGVKLPEMPDAKEDTEQLLSKH